ncbi:DNA fragmentation factor subunit alpha-like isoform X2 [Ptychodera flava]|uniref:DNA fragmentation factor subunit alpha-like isoform X2 n=1 Tax=Ptychodera flava TaxID=63121 RepID=UPI00396A5CB3
MHSTRRPVRITPLVTVGREGHARNLDFNLQFLNICEYKLMASTPQHKPFKVWNSTRDIRKSLVAKDFDELKEKGKSKLGLSTSEDVTIVLEEDGTEVDEEEYFKLLPSNTVFIVLQRGQRWKEVSASSGPAFDELDNSRDGESGRLTEVDSGEPAANPKLREIARRLQRDIGTIITLSNVELQMIAECDTNTLATLVDNAEEFASTLQNACQRYLDDRQSATEAVELLKLYHRARKSKDNTESMQT